MHMAALSPQIVDSARKSERCILQALAQRSQVRVAELLGVSESTVSRTDKTAMAAFLAACGLKVVGAAMQCHDADYIHSLKVLAGVGLQAPSPKTLDWDDQ